ncbi:MAG: EamA family transporter RarD [Candidatus Marinimicrobia bacterium]|nr:EamA family transporter RarD [Candidatus Neomarinimicrobiota bacterium]MCF7828376.1 EamA family transporter RarD [Candidatus Neomarinimicrobiota bacterium]MCF7881030.1 EamA family transporter RarD [Candidatus Neomarinimicrobiota bacterium]
MTEGNSGRIAAVGAYALWGLLPIFWKFIDTIPAIEILAHRIVWSLAFTLILLTITTQWSWILKLRSSPATYLPFLASAVILGLNWYTYIYAMNSDHIVEASLGYFINPLFSVVLGVIFLRERLRRLQWIAVGLALIGVMYLTWNYGRIPWIALTLALTFGIYGLLRKTASLGSLRGLTLEMMVLFLPALIFLTILHSQGNGSLGQVKLWENVFLILTGAATATPLLLFAYGAKRIPLASIGILQYIAPTLQFLLGVFIYREPFTGERLVGFILIWIALGLYTGEGIAFRRRRNIATRLR